MTGQRDSLVVENVLGDHILKLMTAYYEVFMIIRLRLIVVIIIMISLKIYDYCRHNHG